MHFDIKFQPLKIWSDFCHKVLGDFNNSIELEFHINSMSSTKSPRESKDIPTTLTKHGENYHSWVELVKKCLSRMLLNNISFSKA